MILGHVFIVRSLYKLFLLQTLLVHLTAFILDFLLQELIQTFDVCNFLLKCMDVSLLGTDLLLELLLLNKNPLHLLDIDDIIGLYLLMLVLLLLLLLLLLG